MKISANAVIAGLTVLMVIGLIFVVIYGCMSFSSLSQEHFTTNNSTSTTTEKGDDEEEDTPAASSTLTRREKELFEDLKNNNLSTEQIGELVSEGVLTEKLVEKFLTQLNITPEEAPSTGTTTERTNRNRTADAAPKEDEEFTIEGFSGCTYAKY